MPALSLKPAKRATLRAQAHALKPVVMIGNDGLTEAVLAEIEQNLSAHELIKIRVLGDDRDTRIAIYQDICERLNAAPIQHIGKLLLIWRALAAPQPQEEKVSKGAPRLVTIIKPNPNPSRRPQAKRVLVRGNERVTTGGIIKRAKKRQTGTKRQHQSEK